MNRAVSTVVVAVVSSAAHGQTILGPTEYLSFADSPFEGFTGVVLEDFEDGFNTAGVTSNASIIIAPGSNTDSVDADDGTIDGSGAGGQTLFTGSGAVGITFTFDEGILGELPKAAGIVWTDGGGTITFEAFDRDGMLIGETQGDHADANFLSGTGEDRFYGVIFDDGVGSIRVSNTSGGIEVDHLQFAFVPTPGTLGLAAVGSALLIRRRR